MLHAALDSLSAGLDWASSHIFSTLLLVIVGTFLVMTVASALAPVPKPAEYQPEQCGDITKQTLRKYDGRDPFLPIYFAVRGEVFDVTKGRDFYGPGGGYAVFAGKEVSRALGLMSLDADDCCGELADLTPRQLEVLDEWVAKFRGKYHVVGRVVPEQRLTLQQLAEFDGSEAAKPIMLAIRGTVFDVTKGREFYGADGVYPFAGRECARALALQSTDTADCHDDLEGLGKFELDNLRDWEARFHAKYNIVGSLVITGSTPA
jgi:membrane-associated progesterone receptor component